MSEYDAGGNLPGPGVRAWSRGPCPLDGYLLVEIEPCPPLEEGGWEHVVPAAEAGDMAAARRRIAEAHATERPSEEES